MHVLFASVCSGRENLMGKRRPGRPRKSVEEKRKRKTETQRHRREGERMAGELADAIYSFHMMESAIPPKPRDRDAAEKHESQ
jgi:hypothetical protein